MSILKTAVLSQVLVANKMFAVNKVSIIEDTSKSIKKFVKL